MMRKCLLALCAALLMLLGTALAEDGLTIVHATDMHYYSPALHDDSAYFMEILRDGDGKVTHYAPQLMQAFVAQMLQLQPDAIILSGDLTLNGEVQSHRELAAMLQPLADAGIRVLALSGNHDAQVTAWGIQDEEAYAVDGLMDDQFDEVYARLGYDGALARDAASHSYVAELSPQVRCLLVDTNTNGTNGTVNEQTLRWLEEQLADAQSAGATVIAVSHQPALVHNRMFTFGYVINNASRLLALYERYGVTLNLAGHLHMQHIAQSGSLTEIATSSLAVAPLQYGVLRVEGGQLISYETQAVDVAAWAQAEGETDPALLDFAAYARSFFDQVSLGGLEETLAALDVTETEAAMMEELALTLNAEYFAGSRSAADHSAAWQLWLDHASDSFFVRYLDSMLQETQPMNRYTFAPQP